MNSGDDRTRQFFHPASGAKMGQYVLGERLGVGGMGEVFLAEDTSLGRKVALKFLPLAMAQDEEFRARFLREARAAASLNHPNVVHVYEVGEHGGRPFFAMEYASGESLRDLLARSDLPLPRALALATQIAEGLREAHAAGIVHRDLKPANVMLDAKGNAKLLDFGLAVLEGGDRVTQAGTTLGTVGYMAPEQVRGEEVDSRADLFSFGVLLYELIAGHAPFRRDAEAATLQAILTENPEPLARYRRDASEGLQRLVDKLLDKDRETRCQSAADLVADLKRERAGLEATSSRMATSARPAEPGSGSGSVPAGTPGSGGMPAAAPEGSGRGRAVPIGIGVLLAAVVAVLFILKPWSGREGGPPPVEAGENRLVVLYFENVPEPDDPRRTGEILSSLLITDLSESRYLQVVSTQRLYDLLEQLGHGGEKRVPPSLATQVAEKAGARWMLTGSVLQSEPRLVVTSELVDRTSGDVVASQRVNGAPGEDIFAVVDRLSVALKSDLALPEAAAEEPDRPVADVTTHSPEAFRAYLQGMEAGDNLRVTEAAEHFKRAIALDSTFVMANLGLVRIGDPEDRYAALQRAVRHKDKAGWRERQMVEANVAYGEGRPAEAAALLREITARYPDDRESWVGIAFMERAMNRFQESVEALENVVSLDPLDGPAWNQLAYSYLQLGDSENALRAADEYVQLEPEEPNPYDTRGDILAAIGRLREALENYKKVRDINPSFHPVAPFKIGAAHMFLGDSTAARQVFRELASSDSPGQRSGGRAALGILEAWFGRMDKARAVLRDGIAADELAGETQALEDKKDLLFDLLMFDGRPEEALKLVPESDFSASSPVVMDRWFFDQDQRIAALLDLGRVEEAREVLGRMRDAAEGLTATTLQGAVAFSASRLAQAEGDLDRAIEAAEESREYLPDPLSAWHLGRLYLEKGRADRAVELLSSETRTYREWRVALSPYNALCYYELGRAYEASGWEEKAVEAYQAFLEQWRNGDPDLPYVNEARERVRALESNP